MKQDSLNSMTKDQLTSLIDSFQFHTTIILLCMDEIEAMLEIKREVSKKKRSENFLYISYYSLIFRYEIELTKLVCKDEKSSIYRICSLCKKNSTCFSSSPEYIVDLCKQIKKDIKKYSKQNKNLENRRNKALAHSESEYYYYDQKYIEDFPLNYHELRKEAEMIFDFACILQRRIGSRRSLNGYPTQSDDVKHLFGLKTKADIEDEEWIKENWNKE